MQTFPRGREGPGVQGRCAQNRGRVRGCQEARRLDEGSRGRSSGSSCLLLRASWLVAEEAEESLRSRGRRQWSQLTGATCGSCGARGGT